MFMSRAAAVVALSLFAVAPAQAQPTAPVRVINVQSYYYNPAPIVLRAGAPVTLQFVNRAGKGHDFTARRFFSSARILAGRVADGEVELRPGQVVNVTLIPAAGRYPVHCSHPFHKLLGMHSTIFVQ
jgi:plastocyanin